MVAVHPKPFELAPGQELLGRYRLDAPLAQGGMAVVWRGTHLVLRSPVAIKFDRTTGAKQSARFAEEARLSAMLSSPHIVRVLDAGSEQGSAFLVMELLEGETLAERLACTRTLSPGETASLARHLVRGLTVAHNAGVIHRDLKPGNVFLQNNGDAFQAKLLDFGIAHCASSNRTEEGDFLGTPRYMSPEQAKNPALVDHRSDLWALALIVFECLTGRSPYGTNSNAAIVHGEATLKLPSQCGEVPAAFDEWFDKATKADPAERFQRPEEWIEALHASLSLREQTSSLADSALPTTLDANPAENPLASSRSFRRVGLFAVGTLILATLGWMSLRALDQQPSPLQEQPPRKVVGPLEASEESTGQNSSLAQPTRTATQPIPDVARTPDTSAAAKPAAPPPRPIPARIAPHANGRATPPEGRRPAASKPAKEPSQPTNEEIWGFRK